jgi:polysaccharide export outer membrane protein
MSCPSKPSLAALTPSAALPVLVAALLALALPPVSGQQMGLGPGAGSRPTVGMDMGEYVLSPGDVLKVTVYQEPDLSGSYMIGPTGTISLPFAEQVQASGLTLQVVRDAIVDQLRLYIKRPVVQVQIDPVNSVRHVYVGGRVQNPGQVVVPFAATVAEAVISAGVTPEADLSAVRLNRAGEDTRTVDLSGLQGEGPIDRTQTVREGDVVYVPRHLAEFSVIGMVAQPGSFMIAPDQAADLTVLRALNQAGGYTTGADLATALLIRGDGSSETINLRALLFDGDMTQNKSIGDQDVLVVREAGTITVAGEVTSPGVFQVAQPITVLEAIARAAGFTSNADLKRGSILGEDGSRTVDLEGLWWRGEVENNVPISPGETLLVPERDPEEVLVVGAVETAGTVDLRASRDRSVLRLVQAATPTDAADLDRVMVHRLGEEAPLTADVRAVMEEGNMEENIPLQAGDIVFVPELDKVYAIGAFVAAGAYPLTPDMRLMDLVAQARSFRPDALPAEMRLIRSGPDGAEVIPINFRRVQEGRDTEIRLLQAGDVVFLPAKKGGGGWSSIRDAIWATLAVASLF